VEVAFVLAHALLPTGIWLGFFGLVFQASRNASLAATAAWLASIVAAAPRNALLLGADAFIQPLELTRTPHPALSTAVLLLALWGVIQCLSRPGRKWVWITGSLMGGLFYTYYFHVVAGWTALGAVLAFSVLSGSREWRRIGVIAVIGMAVAMPYMVWTVSSIQSGNSLHLMRRIGIFGRAPDWAGLVGLAVSAGLFIWVGLKRRQRVNAPDKDGLTIVWIVSALLAGAFTLTNVHLLTGYNAQHDHAYNRLVQPFVVILVAVGLSQGGARLRRCLTGRSMRWLLNLTTLAIITLALYRQARVATAMEGFQQESAGHFKQLTELGHAEGELVVGVLDEQIRALLPATTRHWSFVPIGFRSLASNEEILTRFVTVAKLSGLERSEARELLSGKAASGQMRTYSYGLLDDYELQASDALLFEKLWDATNAATALQQRRLDLLVVVPGQAPPSIRGLSLAPAFSSDGWNAYRISLVPDAR